MTASGIKCSNHEFASVKRARSRQLNNRRGFTLIELLVVIGIIGVLAAILIPTVNRSLQRGKRVTCQNNLRQMGTGLLLIAQSESPISDIGTLPRHGGVNPINSLNYTWFGLLANELGFANRTEPPLHADTLIDEKPSLFFCPTADRAIAGWEKENFSYGYNVPMGAFRLSKIGGSNFPGLVGDSHGDGLKDGKRDYAIEVNNDVSGTPRPPGTRHAGGGNVVFVDGRVEWQTFTNLIHKSGPFYVGFGP